MLRPRSGPPVARPPTTGRDELVQPSDPTPWGRVDETGAVFVKTAAGERAVGSWAAGDPAEALAFYGRRYDALVGEIDIVARRVGEGVAKPDDALRAIASARAHVAEAAVVGDLDGLLRQLDELEVQVGEHRQRRREERERVIAAARTDKDALVAEAESIAEGTDWRGGSDKMRALLDRWKALPRLDKSVDDALWERFAAARATYTRRRRTHFAEQADQRNEARERKTAIVTEAEALATSTDWGATSARFRALMSSWKAAGPAPRAEDDELWARFRAAQDTFFGNRTTTFESRDRGELTNQQQKEELLTRAEALLPIRDLGSAKASLREIHERWEAIGRVPRAAIARLEGRLRKVEEAVRAAEQAEWTRTSPEALARAETTVSRLQQACSQLEATLAKAEAKNDANAARAARESLEARRSWLAEAEKTLADLRR